MRNFLMAYLRFYDIAVYVGQCGRGYLRTRFTPAKFGRVPNVRGKVRLHIRGQAVFGDQFTALGDAADVRIVVARGARLTVGDHVAVNCGVSIDVWHEVRIGDKVMLAPYVSIIDDARHEMEPGTLLYNGPTVIGDNVWLAAHVSVLPGVTIGSGSVIGGHSVVTRDIPPNSFAAGSPARVIRTLNVPEGWSHRFGYERNKPAVGLLAGLRRTLAGDPNAAIAAAEQAGHEQSAEFLADREVVG